MFKVIDPSIPELQELKHSLTKTSFYIMVFNEKICRIKTFDVYPTLETRGVFLDMSKAFDKV